MADQRIGVVTIGGLATCGSLEILPGGESEFPAELARKDGEIVFRRPRIDGPRD